VRTRATGATKKLIRRKNTYKHTQETTSDKATAISTQEEPKEREEISRESKKETTHRDQIPGGRFPQRKGVALLNYDNKVEKLPLKT